MNPDIAELAARGEKITADGEILAPTPDQTSPFTFKGDWVPLADALAKAQGEIPIPVFNKVAQAGRQPFKYADIGELYRVTLPVLARYGLWSPGIVSSQEGGRSTLTLLVAGSCGGRGGMIWSTWAYNTPKGVKEEGSELTYRSRYQWATFFRIRGDDHDPDGGEEIPRGAKRATPPAPKAEPKQPTVPKMTPTQQTEITQVHNRLSFRTDQKLAAMHDALPGIHPSTYTQEHAATYLAYLANLELLSASSEQLEMPPEDETPWGLNDE